MARDWTAKQALSPRASASPLIPSLIADAVRSDIVLISQIVERKLDEAHQLLTEVDEGRDRQPLGSHYNSTLLTMQTAICHTEAGQPRRAAELYREWLSANEFSPRDYGYFLSLMASSPALAGEPDEAARTGLASVPLARETNSGRTMRELTKVLTTLTPWKSRAAVQELREAVAI